MQIGEHEVKFIDELTADPWWDLWGEVNDIEADDEGHFKPAEAWDWDLLSRFLDAAIEKWDGEPLEDPGQTIPLAYVNAVSLAAYNHVSELFLSSLPNSENESD
jgi:hypothetical protein